MNIPAKFGIILTAIENLECKIEKLKARNQAFLASNSEIRDAIRYPLYEMIHAHKPVFAMKGKLLNLGNLYFDIVSDLGFRNSDFASTGIFTLVVSALQIHPFLCKTNPISEKPKMNVNKVLTKSYEQLTMNNELKNEPKTKPIRTQPVVSLPALPALSAVEGSAVEGSAVEGVEPISKSGDPYPGTSFAFNAILPFNPSYFTYFNSSFLSTWRSQPLFYAKICFPYCVK